MNDKAPFTIHKNFAGSSNAPKRRIGALVNYQDGFIFNAFHTTEGGRTPPDREAPFPHFKLTRSFSIITAGGRRPDAAGERPDTTGAALGRAAALNAAI